MIHRDAYILVSELGNEPLLVEMALQAKQKKQLVIAVINRDSYSQAKVVHSSGKKLCDLADLEIITDLPKQDIITKISGYPVGQLFGTVINVLAQCLCADLYTQYINNDLEAPVLLSANVRGADAHNKALTDVFCGRVR